MRPALTAEPGTARKSSWEQSRLPRGVRAVLSALCLDGANEELLGSLDECEWQETLAFCDRAQLTLPLCHRCSARLPDRVRERIRNNLADNTQRTGRVKRDVFEACSALSAAGAEYVMLKGLAQWPAYVSDPSLRVQYDLDLFCPPDSLLRARKALLGLGFEPLGGVEKHPVDHLPAMIRKTGWEWRGNYFDPEIPIAVDLHFRFWDGETEGFDAPGVEKFWERRTERIIDGQPLWVLHPADGLAYAALHMLRHLLRGSLRLSHVYELASFLEAHSDDVELWNTWQELHPDELRRLEAIAFRLAADWFRCRLSEAAGEEVRRLDPDVQLWFDRYAVSPVEGLFRPNKHELWLHLCLLDTWRAKRKVLRRRLLPSRLPAPVAAVSVPESEKTARVRWEARLKYGAHLASRAVHHARAMLPALGHGLRWWIEAQSPGKNFWAFLLTATIYEFGVFIFVLLYNLYLLGVGFEENLLGLVWSAFTLGNLAGAVPAAWLGQRLGLKRTLIVCFAGTAAISAARSLVTGEASLVATAFLGGLFTSTWFVSFAPAVSGLTSEKKRPLGFSLFFAAGIGTGILGGLAGGHLPGWIRAVAGVQSAVDARRAALLVGCGFSALALLPLARLSLPGAVSRETRVWPWNPFLARFLAVLAVWSFATGAFHPLFNAYFARRLEASEAQIGMIFSASQLAQVIAVLAAPFVLRRFGLIGGIAGLQLAAALALASLAGGLSLLAAGAVYAGYMSFRAMTEPGVYSLLMSKVAPAERSGAASLNFVVIFSTNALAAAASGGVVTAFGYPAMLGCAAAMAALAAILFRMLLKNHGD